jgi:hypothetical protein
MGSPSLFVLRYHVLPRRFVGAGEAERIERRTVGNNPEEPAVYYREFGLDDDGDVWFASRDGGRQLRLVTTPARRLVELRIGVDDADDLARAASRLRALGIDAATDPAAGTLTASDQATHVQVVLQVTPRLRQPVTEPTPYNGPGRTERAGTRAPGILRTGRVSPRRLGHVVIGTTEFDATTAFFRDGLGLRASDYIKDAGAFLRCSTDHHNVLVLRALHSGCSAGVRRPRRRSCTPTTWPT